MRALVLLLLLICITATVIPCCAVDGCSDEIAATPTDGKQEEGTCSPFFTCTSCPTAVVTTSALHLETPPVIAIPAYPAHHSFPLSTYSSSFWQPPRLG